MNSTTEYLWHSMRRVEPPDLLQIFLDLRRDVLEDEHNVHAFLLPDNIQNKPREDEEDGSSPTRSEDSEEEEEQLTLSNLLAAVNEFWRQESTRTGDASSREGYHDVLYYRAFKFGYTSYRYSGTLVPHMEASTEIMRILGFPKDGYPFKLWFQLVLWMRIGGTIEDTQPQSTIVHRSRHTMLRHTKPLSLEHFKQGKMWEDLPTVEESNGKKTPFAIFISHRWQKEDHPDRDGTEKRLILPMLQKTQDWLDYLYAMTPAHDFEIPLFVPLALKLLFKSPVLTWAMGFFVLGYREIMVWYDYYSVPQGKDKKAVIAECLKEIDVICAHMPVLAVPTEDYFTRGWCFFEAMENMLGRVHTLSSRRKPYFYMNGEVEGESPWLECGLRLLFGRFCRRIELGDDPHATLVDIGLECTQGSDIRILSTRMQTHSKEGQRADQSWYRTHPINTAFWQFFQDLQHKAERGRVLLKEERQRQPRCCFCFHTETTSVSTDWSSNQTIAPNLNSVLKFCQHLIGRMEHEGRAAPETEVYTRYFHPEVGMSYLVEAKADWPSPTVWQCVPEIKNLFHALATAGWGCPEDVELRDFHPQCQVIIEQLNLYADEVFGLLVKVSKMHPKHGVNTGGVLPTNQDLWSVNPRTAKSFDNSTSHTL